MTKKYNDPDWLEEKYVDEGLSGYEIADICGVAGNTIHTYINRYNISREEPKYKDSQWLRQKYIKEDLNQREIADICDVTNVCISQWLKRHGIRKSKTPIVKCDVCGSEFAHVSSHWRNSDCGYPNLTNYQREVIIGLLMGDGYVSHEDDNKMPLMQVGMVTKEFLEHLDSEVFPKLGTGVSLSITGEEAYRKGVESGFFNEGDDYECQDAYRWNTRRHPSFSEFSEWYSSGEKIWDYESISLTPTVLKYLYVCDGNFKNDSDDRYIRIGISNESSRKSQIRKLFSDVGFKISRFEESKRKDGSLNTSVIFDVQTSKDMFEYMGESLPGFEYKWPSGGM